MNEILNTMITRRSIRQYTDEEIPEEKLNKILQAGLLAPSGRAIYPSELILVTDEEILAQMSKCRSVGASMLDGAKAAIVVIADTDKTDVWVEDASIVMSYMQLEACELGIGSCWIQCRRRMSQQENVDTDAYLRELLAYPENYSAEAILSLGYAEKEMEPHDLPDVNSEKIHREKF